MNLELVTGGSANEPLMDLVHVLATLSDSTTGQVRPSAVLDTAPLHNNARRIDYVDTT